MKRLISILLVAAVFCTGLAACSNNNADNPANKETTDKADTLPVIEAVHEVEKFKAMDGKVSYILDITLPKITENVAPDMIDLIDFHYSEIRNEAFRYAEANIENARYFMNNIGDGKTPWQRTISFKTVYSSEEYLSIEITDHSTMTGGQTTPTVYATLFNLKNPGAVSLYDLAKTDEETLKKTVVDLMIRKIATKFYPDGTELSEEQKQTVADSFNPYNYCYTPSGITVYINKLLIDQSYSGTFCCKLTFPELRKVISPLTRTTKETTTA